MRFLLLFLVSVVFADDIDSLQDRLIAEYLKGGTANAATYLSQQQANGSWTDINYADRSSATWAPVTHLSRLQAMAVAYNRSDNPGYLDTAMFRGIVAGLDYWYANDAAIYSSNWWWNDIGQQLNLGPLLIMMEAYLDSVRVQTGSVFLNDPSLTGQNLVWMAQQTVWRGCLRESLTDVNSGLNAIKGEVRITTSEGIQPDFSFHQHGPQLYNGGYGRGFMEDAVFWALMTQGLSFAFDATKMNILTGLILDGSQWMVRRNDWDFACGGREVSRQGWAKFGSALKNRLPLLGSPRQAELQAFVNHTNGLNDSALTGDRHFWRSDFHVLRQKNFHLSVRMCSHRTTGTENYNNEHKKNWYVPFGATVLLRNGDEYYGIYPIWDWARIPGVTCPHNPSPGSGMFDGTTDFVGGVSNGKCGAVGFDLLWDGVTGKKAWFCFNREVVALGAGIACNGALPVFTSVNQCWLRGNVWTAADTGAGATVAQGECVLDNPKWVFHDSVGYVFPVPAQITLKNQLQTGSWGSINAMYSSTPVSGDVFSLWQDHGLRPSGAAYQYILLPGTDMASVQAYAARVPVRILSNTPDIQAVWRDSLGMAGIVFHRAGSLVVRYGLSLEADKPCALLLDESGTTYKATVANPLNTSVTVNVKLIFQDGRNETLAFALPSGGDAGKSVTRSFSSAVSNEGPKSFLCATVTDSATGLPLRQVRLEQAGVMAFPVFTDSLGSALLHVDSGRVAVQVLKPFYGTRLDSFTTVSGETLTVNIRLAPLPRTGLRIMPSSLSLPTQDSARLLAFHLLAGGVLDTRDTLTGNVAWSIAPSGIADVDANGRVTTLSALGSAVVACSSLVSGFAGTCSLNVVGLRFSLSPTDDDYVRDGTYGNDNYGTQADLVVKNGGGDYTRQTYLMFDLSPLQGNTAIASATLKLCPTVKRPVSSIPFTVFGVDSDDWSENTLTWNTKPAIGAPLDTVFIAAETLVYYSWDVTPFTAANALSDGKVSFCVTEPGSVEWFTFASKEAANDHPVLEVVAGAWIAAEGRKRGAEPMALCVSPNPFNPSVRIRVTGLQEDADVSVFTPDGRLAARLCLEKGAAEWNATEMPSGLYLVQVRSGKRTLRAKAVLLK